MISLAKVAKARLSALSGYYIITITNITLFILNNIATMPFPFIIIFNSVYISVLSWLI